ncbi:MAG: UrcA family protein [Pseudomonadota bacterium]
MIACTSTAFQRAATINYADLNLGSQKGQEILDRRIEAALEKVCGRLENRPIFDGAVRKCQTQTRITAQRSRDLAIARYNNPQLASNDAAKDKRQIWLVVR